MWRGFKLVAISGTLGLFFGGALGYGAAVYIPRANAAAHHVEAAAPLTRDQRQRNEFIAACERETRGSVPTPATVRIAEPPKYVRHSVDGSYYLDEILQFDAQNEYGALIRRTAFCQLRLDSEYQSVRDHDITIDGLTNFQRALNEMKKDIPGERVPLVELDWSEYQYTLNHGA